jgi:hypothetical protein
MVRSPSSTPTSPKPSPSAIPRRRGEEPTFIEIEPLASSTVPTAAQISGGIPIPPVRLLQVLSPEDWEAFTEEWLSYHKAQGTYQSVRRFAGPGDLGLDVVAFTSANGFSDPWDSYQCKHYDHALEPNDIYGEIAKIIYHSFKKTPPFNQACQVPRRHIFVSPHGVGISVSRWLKDPKRLKEQIRKDWEHRCVPKIGKGVQAPLVGRFLAFFDDFDFSIFEDRTAVELMEEHAKTIFHAARFGGGLPPRAPAPAPPAEPAPADSLYLRKLLDVYGDHLSQTVAALDELVTHPDLQEHYKRQRVLFYTARADDRDVGPRCARADLRELGLSGAGRDGL